MRATIGQWATLVVATLALGFSALTWAGSDRLNMEQRVSSLEAQETSDTKQLDLIRDDVKVIREDVRELRKTLLPQPKERGRE